MKKRMATTSRSKCGIYGFTLLEMSIVLVIIGTVVASSTVLFAAYLRQQQYQETQAKLAAIQKALLDFRRAYDRLPCPADVTAGNNSREYLAQTNASGVLFGLEAQLWFNTYRSNGVGCYASSTYRPSANIIDDRNNTTGIYQQTQIAVGMIPTRTLGLSDDFAIDGWGNRIMYAVDTSLTAPSITSLATLPDFGYYSNYLSAANNSSVYVQRISIYRINSLTSVSLKTSNAAYAVFSHGANGFGAWPRSTAGALAKWSYGTSSPNYFASQSALEYVNCNCDLIGSNRTANAYPTSSSIINSNASGYPGGLMGYFDYSANTNATISSAGTPAFIQSIPVQNSALPDGTGDFDDIVVFATRAQLPGYNE